MLTFSYYAITFETNHKLSGLDLHESANPANPQTQGNEKIGGMFLLLDAPKSLLQTRISGSANSKPAFVIASRGEMASFAIGMTPCFLEIQSARGTFAREIPRRPDDAADQHTAGYLPIR